MPLTDIPKLALVGCGAVAEMYHAPALKLAEEAGWLRVEALVDPDRKRREVLGNHFPSARRTESLQGIPDHVSLAIVASPVQFHAAQTIALLDRGLSVLCEKPLCRNSDESAALAGAASRASGIAATGLFRRFFPATEQIRSLIQPGGALGAPVRFAVEEGGLFGWPAASASFFDRKTAGGGVTMDIGSHQLDLLTWWFGDVAEFDYRDDAYGGVECNAFGRLRFAGGVEGTFRLSWDLPTANEYEIRFERGTVRWATGRADRISVTLDGAEYALDAVLAEADPRRPMGLGTPGRSYLAAFTAQIRNFVEAAAGREEPRVSLADGIRNLQLIERLYQSRETWVPAWFSETEGKAARQLAGGSS